MKHSEEHHEKKSSQEEAPDLASATENRQQLTKLFARKLLKTALHPLAALAIIAICSIAWFVANSRVQSDTNSINAGYKTVRLASEGVRQSAEEDYLRLDPGQEYNYDNKTYFWTEDSQIALYLSKDDYVISPGASGSATFYILPVAAGPDTVTLYLDLAGYKHTSETEVERIADPILDTLLSGHILLFQQYEDGHYSGRLLLEGADGKLNHAFSVHLPEDTQAGVPFPVTLYWIWPLRYENMLGELYAKGDSEYDALTAFIEKQAETLTAMQNSSYRYSRIFLTNEPLSPGEMKEPRTKAYNLADEYIGTNAEYLYLTIQTAPVGSSMESSE